eukprot:Polyplicarium_translucidae@DN2182_c0_g1_i1.p1
MSEQSESSRHASEEVQDGEPLLENPIEHEDPVLEDQEDPVVLNEEEEDEASEEAGPAHEEADGEPAEEEEEEEEDEDDAPYISTSYYPQGVQGTVMSRAVGSTTTYASPSTFAAPMPVTYAKGSTAVGTTATLSSMPQTITTMTDVSRTTATSAPWASAVTTAGPVHEICTAQPTPMTYSSSAGTVSMRSQATTSTMPVSTGITRPFTTTTTSAPQAMPVSSGYYNVAPTAMASVLRGSSGAGSTGATYTSSAPPTSYITTSMPTYGTYEKQPMPTSMPVESKMATQHHMGLVSQHQFASAVSAIGKYRNPLAPVGEMVQSAEPIMGATNINVPGMAFADRGMGSAMGAESQRSMQPPPTFPARGGSTNSQRNLSAAARGIESAVQRGASREVSGGPDVVDIAGSQMEIGGTAQGEPEMFSASQVGRLPSDLLPISQHKQTKK